MQCSPADNERALAAREALQNLIAAADRHVNASAIVEALFRGHCSAAAIYELCARDLMLFEGMTAPCADAVDLIDELCRYTAVERFGSKPPVGSCVRAGEYLSSLYIGLHVEYCYLLCINARGRLMKRVLMQKGTIDQAAVYVRQIAEVATREGAAYMVLSHNHPGGGVKPSAADCEITESVIATARVINCPLLDHIIVADQSPVSIRKYGVPEERFWRAQAPESAIMLNWLAGFQNGMEER